MLRQILLLLGSTLVSISFAQTGVKGTQVMDSVPVVTVEEPGPKVSPLGASAAGDFDQAPAHPACDALKDQERLDCTAALVLELIRGRNGEPRLDLERLGGSLVTIDLGVNQFGDAKDVRVDQLGDPQLHRNISTALYALPTLKPALKDGTRTTGTLTFKYPYEELFTR